MASNEKYKRDRYWPTNFAHWIKYQQKLRPVRLLTSSSWKFTIQHSDIANEQKRVDRQSVQSSNQMATKQQKPIKENVISENCNGIKAGSTYYYFTYNIKHFWLLTPSHPSTQKCCKILFVFSKRFNTMNAETNKLYFTKLDIVLNCLSWARTQVVRLKV